MRKADGRGVAVDGSPHDAGVGPKPRRQMPQSRPATRHRCQSEALPVQKLLRGISDTLRIELHTPQNEVPINPKLGCSSLQCRALSLLARRQNNIAIASQLIRCTGEGGAVAGDGLQHKTSVGPQRHRCVPQRLAPAPRGLERQGPVPPELLRGILERLPAAGSQRGEQQLAVAAALGGRAAQLRPVLQNHNSPAVPPRALCVYARRPQLTGRHAVDAISLSGPGEVGHKDGTAKQGHVVASRVHLQVCHGVCIAARDTPPLLRIQVIRHVELPPELVHGLPPKHHGSLGAENVDHRRDVQHHSRQHEIEEHLLVALHPSNIPPGHTDVRQVANVIQTAGDLTRRVVLVVLQILGELAHGSLAQGDWVEEIAAHLAEGCPHLPGDAGRLRGQLEDLAI
mmetsp:Transcript_2598/g.10015  ORF Transcript_2598/g.10015 Transcript_2598/m.10015 type:complete len:398 (+) Transcript_2598:1115-2308(+)